LRKFEPDLLHRIFEEQAVFGFLDGIDLGADQFYAVLVEHSGFGQRDGEVQAGLSANGRKQCIGPFLLDDLFQIRQGERLYVSAVCQFGIRHDGGGI